MAELQKYKMVLRDISPKFIALSNDMQLMQFCSLENVAKYCKQEEEPFTGNVPYCCQQILKLSRHLPARSFYRDEWSIGIIVLEILVGTEVVIHVPSALGYGPEGSQIMGVQGDADLRLELTILHAR